MRNQATTQRAHHLTLALALAVAACAKEGAEPPATEAPGNTSAAGEAQGSAAAGAKARLAVSPTLGGSVLPVGDYQAELAIHEDGGVRGLVFDAEGQAMAQARVSDFKVTLHAEGGGRPEASLLWDARCPCFQGNGFQGNAELAAGLIAKPVDVSFAIDNSPVASTLAAYTLLPRLDLGARADLAAGGDVKMTAPDVKAKLAAGAKGLADAKANLSSKTSKAAQAAATAKASAAASLPKPAVKVDVKRSQSASAPEETGAKASVKAKASFGFGTK
jgi:hypothetical protein